MRDVATLDSENMEHVSTFAAAFVSLRSAKFGTIEVVLSLPNTHTVAALELQAKAGVYMQFQAYVPSDDDPSRLWQTRRWRDEDFYESVGWRWRDGSPILDEDGYPHPTTMRRGEGL